MILNFNKKIPLSKILCTMKLLHLILIYWKFQWTYLIIITQKLNGRAFQPVHDLPYVLSSPKIKLNIQLVKAAYIHISFKEHAAHASQLFSFVACHFVSPLFQRYDHRHSSINTLKTIAWRWHYQIQKSPSKCTTQQPRNVLGCTGMVWLIARLLASAHPPLH